MKFAYNICKSDEFAPGDLLQPPGGGEPVQGENEIFTTITVGIMLRI